MKKQRRKHRVKSYRKNNLEFQKLEPKNLLAGVTFDAGTGIITVEGSNHADAVQVQPAANNQIRVVFNGVDNRLFDVGDVSEVVFFARFGNDWFFNNTSISSRAYGNGGDDILIGGSQEDRLRGGPGNDRLIGHNGNDHLGGDGGDDLALGGGGDDQINGHWGNDRIWGESGNDIIIAGGGDDFANGGDGNDRIQGYNGDDFLKGGAGADYIEGHAGNDQIFGSYGSDKLFGYGGRDTIFGSFGDDDIYGGEGSDDLHGNKGLDDIFGGQGDDDLYGGRHADQLNGGIGNDDYYHDQLDDLFDDSEDYGADGDFEIRGHVTNLNATSNTFKLLGITVDYSSAEFVANIQNGSFVKSEGSYNGTILQAHEVENEIDDNRDENFEARGTVTNLDTTAKTFAFHGFTVNYSGARLDAQPVNGSQINVEGLLNGSVITATKLEDGDPSGNGGGGGGTHNNGADGDIELRGRITNFNTTTKTFDLLGLRVSFSNAQLIGQLGNGAFVKVDGRYNGTQIVAREVETEIDDNRDENFEARGVISNLDTNAKQFEFLGFSVNYSRAALETQLANGASVEIQGIYANFFVDADEIR